MYILGLCGDVGKRKRKLLESILGYVGFRLRGFLQGCLEMKCGHRGCRTWFFSGAPFRGMAGQSWPLSCSVQGDFATSGGTSAYPETRGTNPKP